jgi:hypothetical protein
MRLSRSIAFALAMLAPACARHDRGTVAVAPHQTSATQFPLSVVVEHPDGQPYATFAHAGSTFVAGERGARYGIRLVNRSARRIEAVVSVDGRDVITGELANFEIQRGYVIEPFGSIVVDGFRQSLDHVAAFRFIDPSSAYSARRGTPQHVGVIGVAAFEERQSRRQRSRKPLALPTHEAPPPTTTTPPPPMAPAGQADLDAPVTDAAPLDESPLFESEAQSPASGTRSRRFAPRVGELGTEYGETTSSSVREVEFKRRRRRRPDVLFTLHYDSPEGLVARGVPVFGPAPVTSAADPFPG